MNPLDQLRRPLRDLRISVTDRCNFRCRYCMPVEVFGADYAYLPKTEILRFSEIVRVAESAVELGVTKLRLTGGEPLLRRNLPELVQMLAEIKGVKDLAMTTNAALLEKYAAELKSSGLHRVTVSLDSLDDETFALMNGVGAKPDRVISGIDAAIEVGLGVKINAVIKKGVNDAGVEDLAQFARSRSVPIRFIEYMDTGNVNGWKLDEVMPTAELLERLLVKIPLVRMTGKVGETATRYHLPEEEGFEVGFISSVTAPFCADCNRARLSADGKVFTCLFATSGYDLKNVIRTNEEGNTPHFDLTSILKSLWLNRSDQYSELRSQNTHNLPKAEMSYLGG